MTGSEFVRKYANTSPQVWEAAAFDLAQNGELVPRAFIPINLRDNFGNTATIKVQNDFLALGTKADQIRLPMTPSGAQNILNLEGWLLPTSKIVREMWSQSAMRLKPQALPNKGPNLNQFYEHSRILDNQIQNSNQLISGAKKHVIVSNIFQPNKVVIFGWIDPSGNVIQGRSNIHDKNYVDYSHGIQAVYPIATLNGEEIKTADLYQDPQYSHLVSDEGPIRVPRYPSNVGVGEPENDVFKNLLLFGGILGLGYYVYKYFYR